ASPATGAGLTTMPVGSFSPREREPIESAVGSAHGRLASDSSVWVPRPPIHGEPDCVGMASRIALSAREGWTLSFFHPHAEEVRDAGDLQHLDHGRVLRVAAGLQAAVRRSSGEAGVPSRGGGL